MRKMFFKLRREEKKELDKLRGQKIDLLEKEIEIMKKCLNICAKASVANSKKIERLEEDLIDNKIDGVIGEIKKEDRENEIYQ